MSGLVSEKSEFAGYLIGILGRMSAGGVCGDSSEKKGGKSPLYVRVDYYPLW
jgi:hypothetical protein